MKLHLPLSLRSAILMACALVSAGQWAPAADSARNAYWIGIDGKRHDIEQYGVMNLDISNAESLILQDNVLSGSYSCGAAISVFSEKGETITSKSVIISGNKAVSTIDSDFGYGSYSRGGALDILLQSSWGTSEYPADVVSFSFSGCGEISITGNGAQAEHSDKEFIGPYNEIDEESKKEMENHPEWDVDSHAQGGAIAVSGGSLYDEETGKITKILSVLEFKNNEHVLLRGNYVTNGTSYILNAIWTLDADVAFAAKSGQVVECYDGLDIDGTLWINTTHPDLRGSDDQSYTGTVILSGEHAEEDLRKIKGSQPTKAEIEESQVMFATAVHVENGTLELREVEMIASRDLSYTEVGGTDGYLFYSANQAEVKMSNSTLVTVWYDGDYVHVGDGSGYTGSGIDDTLDQRGAASLPKATFTGRNIIEANYINAKNGVWVFNVGAANKENAVLRIVSDNVNVYDPYIQIKSRGIDTTGSTFRVNVVGSLAKGQYKLLDYNNNLGTWVGRDSVTLAGAASGSIGTKSNGAGSVYYTIDGSGMLTLWFDYGGGSGASTTPTQRGATTLTWTAPSGTWAESSGSSAKAWSGSVSDLNFYKGDSVVFSKAAEVTIAGVVLPKSVVVSHEAGVVSFQSSNNGQISGETSLVKKGAGELLLGLNNAYTGGTVMEGGRLVVAAGSALGLGEVKLKGGTLDLGGLPVANTLRVSGAAVLNGGMDYRGKLILEGGVLSGEDIWLVKTPELMEGTIKNNITSTNAASALVKSGNGTVRLSGSAFFYGDSVVKSGTLEVASAASFGELVLKSGATLRTYGQETELSGSTIIAEAGSVVEGLYRNGENGSAEPGWVDLANGTVLELHHATVKGDVVVSQWGELWVEDSHQTLEGLVLSGGEVHLVDTLKVEWLSSTSMTGVAMAYKTLLEADGARVNYFSVSGEEGTEYVSLDDIDFAGLEGSRAKTGKTGTTVWVELPYARLTWNGSETGQWGLQEEGGEWKSDDQKLTDRHFYNLDAVTFSDAGEVEVVGTVTPIDIQVTGDHDTAFVGAGSIAGEATLTKEGTGTLEMATQNYGYEGVININGGTLKVGVDGALGNAETYINNATIDAADHAVYGPVIFTGKSKMRNAENVYTVVLANKSSVEGSYTLDAWKTVVVGDEGATFSGRFVFAGGTLSLKGGTLHLEGEVESLSGSLTRDGEPELTLLDFSEWEGLLTSGRTHLLATLETEEDAASWFQLDESLEGRATLSYEDGNLILTLNMLEMSETIYSALSGNQRAVYAALSAIAGSETQPQGELAEAIAAVLGSSDLAEVRALLDRLSGAELATAMTSQIAGNMAHLNRLRGNMGTGQSLATQQPYAAYVVGYDEAHRIDGDAKGASVRRSEWGGTVGFEYGVDKDVLVGISLNQGFSKVDPTGAGQRYDEDDTRADAYVVARFDENWQSVTSVGLGWHSYDITRALPDARKAHSGADGTSINFMQEVSYTARIDDENAVQPFFTLETSYNSIGSFAESGAGTASLCGDARHAWATDLTLGARYVHSFRSAGANGHVRVEAGLIASIGDTTDDLKLRFAGAPGVAFTTSSASPDRIGYHLGAALLLPVTESTAVTASADAILRSNSEEYGVSVGIRTRF